MRPADPERTPELSGTEKEKDERSSAITWYFVFILVSTAFRSFEAGIISSNVPVIQEQLKLDFGDVGMISASPDYGIVPSGLVAIMAFSYLHAASLLNIGYFVISVISLLCAACPSFWMLIFARALSGFCWGFSAVHFPAWINKRAPDEKRTLWLGLFNVMLLLGILIGYAVGSVARTFELCSWEPLYCAEGCLMLVITIAASTFDPQLVQVVDFDEQVQIKGGIDPEAEPLLRSELLTGPEKSLWVTWFLGEDLVAKLPKGLRALYVSNIYVYALMIGSLMAGTVGFVLYFITSFQEEVMSWHPVAIAAVTALVFVIGPVGGVLIGAMVLSRLGGYQNLVNSFTLTLVSSVFVLLFGLGLWLSSMFGDSMNITVTAMVWGYLFSGAIPTAALNGICVNIVPGTSHIASGIQFFTQNLAKMIIPSISGHVIDSMGLVPGFNATLLCCSSLAVLGSIGGYHEAYSVQKSEKAEQDL